MIILISGKQRAGKDTTAKLISNFFNDSQVEIVHFSDKLKELARDLFNMRDKDRELLIDLGSKMREIDEDVWVSYLLKKMESDPDKIWIVADWRFRNEEYFIKEYSNQRLLTIRVEAAQASRFLRSGYTPRAETDPTEMDLDKWSFDYVIHNDGTINHLLEQVIDILSLEGSDVDDLP
jgi:phosphomevalonate kinase